MRAVYLPPHGCGRLALGLPSLPRNRTQTSVPLKHKTEWSPHRFNILFPPSTVRPTQVVPTSSRIPSYYADNSSTTNMVSWQNQQQPHHASSLSLQAPPTANSEYNSTNGGSSDYHVQPWAAPMSTHQQGINTPWTEGRMHQNRGQAKSLVLRYLSATQREEEAWEAKRREARAVGTSRVGVSNTDTGTIASTAPVNTPSNGGSAGWSTNDLGPIDPPVPGGVPDLPPPAYSEHLPHGGPHAI